MPRGVAISWTKYSVSAKSGGVSASGVASTLHSALSSFCGSTDGTTVGSTTPRRVKNLACGLRRARRNCGGMGREDVRSREPTQAVRWHRRSTSFQPVALPYCTRIDVIHIITFHRNTLRSPWCWRRRA